LQQAKFYLVFLSPHLSRRLSQRLAIELERVNIRRALTERERVNDRTAKLEAALRVNAALRVQAERLIAAYVAPESNRGAIINELIALFDGPAQREADRLAAEALGEAPDSINYH
jgi:hypothetical protein